MTTELTAQFQNAQTLYEHADYKSALAEFEALLQQFPNSIEILRGTGLCQMALSAHAAALSLFERGLTLQPDWHEGRYYLAVCQQTQLQFAVAKQNYEALLSQQCQWPEVYNNLALIELNHNNLAQAGVYLAYALSKHPNFVEALNNNAIYLDRIGNPTAAMHYIDKALQLDPNHYKALRTKAKLVGLLDVAASIPFYEAAHRQQPSAPEPLSQLILSHSLLCNFEAAQSLCTLPYTGALNPFVTILTEPDPNLCAQRIQQYADRFKQRYAVSASLPTAACAKSVLHIGYLSGDFRDHPTAYLIRSLFEHHDRSAFTVSLYSYGPRDANPAREHIIQSADHFVELDDLDDTMAAARIREDQVDILIDLKGWTENHRLGIVLHRPAPVQIAYLGFPGTCGDLFDYVIADTTVVPPEQVATMREKILYLPRCYQVNDDQAPVATGTPLRQNYQLPAQGFVFASFNQAFKLDAQRFQTWCRILAAVPDSLLWLMVAHPVARSNLQNFAQLHGIDVKRLIFADKLPHSEHLKRLSLVDLALDTRIYGGHTTTLDALYRQVPVLTCEGTQFASRVAASLLQQVGLDTMIASNEADYLKRAVAYATSPGQQAMVTQTLRQHWGQLFDTTGFCRDLEQALQQVWQAACREGTPSVLSSP